MPPHGSSRSYTLLVGNPGTGKSTLLNGVAGRVVFKSGLSFGAGLTSMLQMHEIRSNFFVGDTPGLSDIALRRVAAKEIEKGLKMNGNYRLMFVVTLEEGRVRPDDATTIELVLSAIDDNIPFGIIINKLSTDECNHLKTNSEDRKRVMTALLAGTKRSTTYFHPVTYLASLAGSDNALPPSSVVHSLNEFFRTVPFAQIIDEQVTSINTETYEEAKEEAEKLIAKIQKDMAEMEKQFKIKLERAKAEADQRMKQQKIQQEKEIAGLRRDMEKLKTEYEAALKKHAGDHKKIEELQKQHQKRISDLQSSLKEVKNRTTTVGGGGGGGGCNIL